MLRLEVEGIGGRHDQLAVAGPDGEHTESIGLLLGQEREGRGVRVGQVRRG